MRSAKDLGLGSAAGPSTSLNTALLAESWTTIRSQVSLNMTSLPLNATATTLMEDARFMVVLKKSLVKAFFVSSRAGLGPRISPSVLKAEDITIEDMFLSRRALTGARPSTRGLVDKKPDDSRALQAPNASVEVEEDSTVMLVDYTVNLPASFSAAEIDSVRQRMSLSEGGGAGGGFAAALTTSLAVEIAKALPAEFRLGTAIVSGTATVLVQETTSPEASTIPQSSTSTLAPRSDVLQESTLASISKAGGRSLGGLVVLSCIFGVGFGAGF